MKETRFVFYTPEYDESSLEGFGCATLGIAAENEWIQPEEKKTAEFGKMLRGEIISGSLAEAEKALRAFNGKEKVRAAVVLFGNCGGENDFMKMFVSLFPGIPVVGGSPAIGSDGRCGRMIPENGEAGIFLIQDDRYEYSVDSLNVHSDKLFSVKVLGSGPREIREVEYDDRKYSFFDFYRNIGIERGLEAGLTEHISVCDCHGRNIHLVQDGDHYFCGADLPSDRVLTLGYVSSEDTCRKMADFYSAENALIFGCAGVKSMIGDFSFPAGKGSVGMFMFGEVLTIDGVSDFGNLMLTRLTVK